MFSHQVEKELTYKDFVRWTSPDMIGKTEVQVSLPRFKMEEKYDLKEVLIKMGMTDAFGVTFSNFSGETYAVDVLHNCKNKQKFTACLLKSWTSIKSF